MFLKKWCETRQICLKKCAIEWAPSRWSSPLTYMAASQPSLYIYLVYKPWQCKCFQKVAQNEADLPKKSAQTNEPSLVWKNTDKKKCDHPMAEGQKNLVFALQIHVLPGLRPRVGQIRKLDAELCQRYRAEMAQPRKRYWLPLNLFWYY